MMLSPLFYATTSYCDFGGPTEREKRKVKFNESRDFRRVFENVMLWDETNNFNRNIRDFVTRVRRNKQFYGAFEGEKKS